MACRLLTQRVGLVYRPSRSIAPSLFFSARSYSAATPKAEIKPINNNSLTEKEAEKSKEIATDSTEKAVEAVDTIVGDKKEDDEPRKEEGYEFGAFHWNMERGSAIALIPLVSTQLVYGAHPVLDGLLGVVLPYHIYMGFESCIIDYIPKRVYPRLHKAANWTLAGTTGLVMWGCYEFNTNDIGITEFMQRLITA